MIVHIVMFKFKDENKDENILSLSMELVLSVANMGFILLGFDDILKFKVEEYKNVVEIKKAKKKTLFSFFI